MTAYNLPHPKIWLSRCSLNAVWHILKMPIWSCATIALSEQNNPNPLQNTVVICYLDCSGSKSTDYSEKNSLIYFLQIRRYNSHLYTPWLPLNIKRIIGSVNATVAQLQMGNFWNVPLLYSVSEGYCVPMSKHSYIHVNFLTALHFTLYFLIKSQQLKPTKYSGTRL
jgi:hypothetical protein